MQKKYFSEAGLQYAQSIIKTNPLEAKTRFEIYLKNYPNDYYARAYYILLLIRLGECEQANSEYNYINNKTANDFKFTSSNKRVVGFQCIMALAKAKLLAHAEKYQELLDFYRNNINLFSNRGDMAILSYYCRNKLGLITDTIDENQASYRYMQTVDYKEERFKEHIKKHQVEYNNDEEINSSLFNEDFPIDKIITEIKKYIPSNKKLYLGLFADEYFFKYNNCGHVMSKSTNYFKVSVFHNTTNFITMCPTLNGENLPNIDLNYMIIEDSNTKVKRLSQIDKFNRRFNRI